MKDIRRDMEGVEHDDASHKNMLYAVIRHRAMIAGLTMASFAISLILMLIKPNVYEAQATILIQPSKLRTEIDAESSPISRLLSGGAGRMSTLSAQTYQGVAISPDMFEKVRDELGIKDMSTQEMLENAQAEIWKGKDSIAAGGRRENSPLLNLIVTAESPQKARDIANKWADVLIKKDKEINASETRILHDVIMKQYAIAKENLETAEKNLEDFKANSDISLVAKRVRIQEDRLADRIARSDEVSAIGNDTEAKINIAKQSFSIDNKKFVEKKRELLRLRREVKSRLKVYNIILEKKIGAEAIIEEDVDIKIIARAVLPTKPAGQGRWKIILLSTFLGFAAGFALAYFNEYAKFIK